MIKNDYENKGLRKVCPEVERAAWDRRMRTVCREVEEYIGQVRELPPPFCGVWGGSCRFIAGGREGIDYTAF